MAIWQCEVDLSEFPIRSSVNPDNLLTLTAFTRIRHRLNQESPSVECTHFFEYDETFAAFYFKLLRDEFGAVELERFYENTEFAITPDISILVDGNMAYNTTALFATVMSAHLMTELYPWRTIPCVPLEVLLFKDGMKLLLELYPPAQNQTIAVRNPTDGEWRLAFEFLRQFKNVIIFNYQKFRSILPFDFKTTNVYIAKREMYRITPLLPMVIAGTKYFSLIARVRKIMGQSLQCAVMNFMGKTERLFEIPFARITNDCGEHYLQQVIWLSVNAESMTVARGFLMPRKAGEFKGLRHP